MMWKSEACEDELTSIMASSVVPYWRWNSCLIWTMSTSHRETITRTRVSSSVPAPCHQSTVWYLSTHQYRHSVTNKHLGTCILSPINTLVPQPCDQLTPWYLHHVTNHHLVTCTMWSINPLVPASCHQSTPCYLYPVTNQHLGTLARDQSTQHLVTCTCHQSTQPPSSKHPSSDEPQLAIVSTSGSLRQP